MFPKQTMMMREPVVSPAGSLASRDRDAGSSSERQ